MLTFEVDDEGLVRALAHVNDKVDSFVQWAALDLEREVRDEAGQYSSRLAAPWSIEGEGPWERHVVAPEWWAHILAHGARPHGPRSADRMVFVIDGDVVVAETVSGTPATHFDEAAQERTRSRVDDILRRLIEEAV